jgi:hypothetical protein
MPTYAITFSQPFVKKELRLPQIKKSRLGKPIQTTTSVVNQKKPKKATDKKPWNSTNKQVAKILISLSYRIC